MVQAELNLMLVSGEPDELRALGQAMQALTPLRQTHAASVEEALALAGGEKFQLVVIGERLDGDPLGLVSRLLEKDAFINTAVVSHEEEQEFHEKSEGLGILTQLPRLPGPRQAAELVRRLKAIAAIA